MRSLQKMGYKLYASLGTADYYNEHGVDVSYFLLVFVNFPSKCDIEFKLLTNIPKPFPVLESGKCGD